MDRTFNRIMNDRKSLMKCGTQLTVGELESLPLSHLVI